MRSSEARPITRPPGHHFFGYYGISPWNGAERLYACLESPFHERPPAAGERATIGVVDLATERFEPLTTTAAWNLQQGAMLHWLPTAPDTRLIFNDLDEAAGRFRPVVFDLETGQRTVVPADHGIAALSPDGREALGLDYARLHTQRPVVGYAGARDRTVGARVPDDDGVWRIDLATGRTTLSLSHAEAEAAAPAPPGGQAKPLFFNHALYSPGGRRFFVLLRYFRPDNLLDSVVLTADAGGGDVRCLVPWGQRVSHFDWLSADEALMTVDHPSGRGRQYVLVSDRPGEGWATRRPLGEGVLVDEGHPSFSPDRRWLLLDSAPDAARLQTLRLYDTRESRLHVLGRYHVAPHLRGDWRCDLHPRWDRSGRRVSFDSVHTGDRQVYVVDVEL